MAAAVADYRPAEPARRQDQEGRAPARNSRCGSSVPTTCSPRSPSAAARASCSSASPPSTATAPSPTAREKLERKRLDAVVVNDIVAPRASASTAPTTRSRSSPPSGERAVPRRPRPQVAAAILDAVLSRRSSHDRSECERPDGADRAAARAGRGARRSEAAAAALSRERIADNIRRAVKVARRRRSQHVIVGAARRGPHPRRGLPGRRQDGAGARARRARSTASSRACSARPTCSRPTSSAPTSTTSASSASSSGPGPIFANVVLVDEINRASPKTQSGLLECMQERHVTVDVHSHELARAVPGLRDPEPGRVRGHLPAARGAGRPLHGPPVARLPERRGRGRACSPATRAATACSSSRRSPTATEVLAAQDAARRVHASRALRDYVVALMRHTRADHARRARRVAARRPDAAARRQGARAAQGPRPRAARRRAGARPRACWPTASCSCPRRRASSARDRRRRDRGDARRSRGGRACAPRSAARRSGSCCCWSRARSTPSRCT